MDTSQPLIQLENTKGKDYRKKTRNRRLKIAVANMAVFFTMISCLSTCSIGSYDISQRVVPSVLESSTRTDLYAEIEYEAVYNPTQSMLWDFTRLANPSNPTAIFPGFLDELASKGFFAIRVPHAPPNYTHSNLLAGNPNDPYSDALTVNYYSPTTATSPTKVIVPITRRPEYENTVNAQYPITDGKSHWEVWWLKSGDKFPVPNETFAFKKSTTFGQEAFLLRFQIDFVDASGVACKNCTLGVLFYNGYTYIGIHEYPLIMSDNYGIPLSGGPVAGFDQHCHKDVTVAQYINPGESFGQMHWLENYDTSPHTFSIAASSSQDWHYTYYTVTTDGVETQENYPFNVMVVAGSGLYGPSCLGIKAVYSPNVSSSDTLRETYTITATDTTDSNIRATTTSYAFAPGYVINETVAPAPWVWMPIVSH